MVFIGLLHKFGVIFCESVGSNIIEGLLFVFVADCHIISFQIMKNNLRQLLSNQEMYHYLKIIRSLNFFELKDPEFETFLVYTSLSLKIKIL